MVEGKTSKGFEFKVDLQKAKSWEFISLMRQMDDNGARIVDVAEFLLGADQLKELVAFIKGDRAYTPEAEVEEALTEIIEALPKN